MAINERVITGTTAAAGTTAAEAEQGLILHLDANDVDSYDGDGSIWYDISEHDVTIPLSDNADDLELHLNASDSNSYSGSGTTWTDLTSNNNATVVASTYDIDNGGYFDITSNTVTFSSNTSALDTATFSFEIWVYQTSNSGTQYFFSDTGISLFTVSGTQMRFIKGFSGTNNDDSYFNPTANGSGWTTNKWNHVAVTFSSTTSKVYINGVLVNTHTEGSGTPTALTTLQISPSLGRWKGYLGAFRVYDITLSASEVGQNYRHGRDYIYTELNGNSDLFLHYDPADTNSYSGTGTTLTDLAGNNNADLLGGIESGWDEELGNSFPMTGSGDGITTSSTVSINPATDGMTIEMWVKVKTDDFSYFFSFDGTNTTGFGLSYRANYDEIWWFYRNSSNNNSIIHSDTIVLNEWTHIVATTNGSSAQFYTNGVLSEETSDNAYSYSYNEDLHFGNLYDLAQNSNSDIGQIRFYKGGLSSDEVLQNYVATKNDYPNGYNKSFSGIYFTPSTPDYFEFDGTSSDYVTLDNTADSDENHDALGSFTGATDIDWTISFYIRTSETGSGNINTGMPILATNSSFIYAQIGIKDNKLCFAGYDTAWYQHKSTTSINDGEWHFCTIVNRNDETMDLYVDGTKEANNVSSALTSGRRLIINTIGQGWQNNYTDMDFGQLKIYDKAMTSSEVTVAFNLDKDTYGL